MYRTTMYHQKNVSDEQDSVLTAIWDAVWKSWMPYAEMTLRFTSKRSGRIGSLAQYASTPTKTKTNPMQDDNADIFGRLCIKLPGCFWIWSRNSKRDIFAKAMLTEPRKSILLNLDRPLPPETSTILDAEVGSTDSLRQM